VDIILYFIQDLMICITIVFARLPPFWCDMMIILTSLNLSFKTIK